MTARSMRLVTILVSAVMATSAAAAVFMLKKDAEQHAKSIGELNRKIAAEKQRISELEAEWSALDHPARLQALMDRHSEVLRLAPIRAEQFATAAEIASAARLKREEEMQ